MVSPTDSDPSWVARGIDVATGSDRLCRWCVPMGTKEAQGGILSRWLAKDAFCGNFDRFTLDRKLTIRKATRVLDGQVEYSSSVSTDECAFGFGHERELGRKHVHRFRFGVVRHDRARRFVDGRYWLRRRTSST